MIHNCWFKVEHHYHLPNEYSYCVTLILDFMAIWKAWNSWNYMFKRSPSLYFKRMRFNSIYFNSIYLNLNEWQSIGDEQNERNGLFSLRSGSLSAFWSCGANRHSSAFPTGVSNWSEPYSYCLPVSHASLAFCFLLLFSKHRHTCDSFTICHFFRRQPHFLLDFRRLRSQSD